MEKLLYTVAEASHLLSIRKTKIYELINSGDLASVKIGRARRIPHSGLLQFVEATQN